MAGRVASSWPIALLLAVLTALGGLAGCGSPGSGAAPAPASVADSPAGQPPPAVDTPDGYQRLLDQTTSELTNALAAVRGAHSLPELDQAVLAAAGVASSASERLTTSGPVPPGVAGDNGELAGALRQFGRELAYLSQQINLHAICAGPTAYAAISTAPSMPALRAAAAALTTPRTDRPGYRWGAALPPATDAPHGALRNGAVLVDRRAGATGDGVLRARNDGGTDAVLLLAKDGAVRVSLAVTAGRSAELGGLPDGDYDLFYTVGKDWDAQLGTFSRHCEFHRFSTPTTFRTSPVAGGSSYTVQSIVLHTPPNPGNGPVPEGPVPAGGPDAEPGTTEVAPDGMPH